MEGESCFLRWAQTKAPPPMRPGANVFGSGGLVSGSEAALTHTAQRAAGPGYARRQSRSDPKAAPVPTALFPSGLRPFPRPLKIQCGLLITSPRQGDRLTAHTGAKDALHAVNLTSIRIRKERRASDACRNPAGTHSLHPGHLRSLSQ